MGRDIDPGELRRTAGRFVTGVTVVTTAHGGVLHGMTANAFASVSLDPPLVLVCVDKQAGLHELLPESKTFAVTVLADDQVDDAEWFASPRRPSGRDQFDDVEWRAAPVTGAPVLAHGIAFIDCRVAEIHEGGDHSVFIGEVVGLGHLRDAGPLVFFSGDYLRLGPVDRVR